MGDSKIQFIGHSSLLVTMGGHNVYVDPLLNDSRCGLSKRVSLPGLNLKNMPTPSLILMTSAHRDCCDLQSFKYFKQDVPIIAPKGATQIIKEYLKNPIEASKPYGTIQINDLKITPAPTDHRVIRFPHMQMSHSLGYILQAESKTVFISGDTKYAGHFSEIGSRFNIDVALLPIGKVSPPWVTKFFYMNPEESLQAFSDLKAKIMIPIKWGAYSSPFEGHLNAMTLFEEALTSFARKDQVKILQIGESFSI